MQRCVNISVQSIDYAVGHLDRSADYSSFAIQTCGSNIFYYIHITNYIPHFDSLTITYYYRLKSFLKPTCFFIFT